MIIHFSRYSKERLERLMEALGAVVENIELYA